MMGVGVAGVLTIASLRFQAGKAPGAVPLTVNGERVVVLVGPNNAGKSLALREIEQWCAGTDAVYKVISQVTVEWPTTGEESEALIRVFEVDPPAGNIASPGNIFASVHSLTPGSQAQIMQIGIDYLRSQLSNELYLRQQLLRLYTARLDGRTRFQLSTSQPTGDLQDAPQNHLWALFQNDTNRGRVRELTDEAFGLHFTVDPTAMTQFRIRMSDRPPADDAEEQGLDARSRAFHSGASPIEDLSDGVQAFTGLVSSIMSLPHKVLLVDEPEAFLHPPLARRLGRNLSDIASERAASLFVSTHSSDFVMGCIESNASTAIVRLTYDQGVATAQALDAGEISSLLEDPLLRSTGALRALFHRAAIVTEADSDRAFYEEVNRRLQIDGRGAADTLFLNAQNWQTIARVIKPLRKIGIAAAGILDLDTVEEASGWPAIYDALALTAQEISTSESLRIPAATALTAIGRDSYKRTGLSSVPQFTGANAVWAYLAHMATFGIFIVSVGELESWLGVLGVGRTAKKRDWITSMFHRLGASPSVSDYVKASTGDVWDFVDSVPVWIADPQRSGMP